MRVALTAPRSELGSVLARRSPPDEARRTGPRVVIDTALQPPNSLLHDGHAWKRRPPERMVAETRIAIRRAARADFLVHAGYILTGAAEAGLEPGRALRPYVDAARRCEEMVLESRVPACVVRLGYLYGPGARHLRAYRRAFRLGRPYWAGPGSAKQRFLHAEDAAAALLAAARERRAGAILAAADSRPVSFATFMDAFARMVGNPLPLHLPGPMRPLSRLIIAAEHMDMVELPTAAVPPRPRPRGFTPAHPTCVSGLRDVLDVWAAGG